MDTGSSCKTAHSNSIPEPGHIRRARADERLGLLALWECSVRATHTFLAEADIDFYRPLCHGISRTQPETAPPWEYSRAVGTFSRQGGLMKTTSALAGIVMAATSVAGAQTERKWLTP
jgi:hypothetical protein